MPKIWRARAKQKLLRSRCRGSRRNIPFNREFLRQGSRTTKKFSRRFRERRLYAQSWGIYQAVQIVSENEKEKKTGRITSPQ